MLHETRSMRTRYKERRPLRPRGVAFLRGSTPMLVPSGARIEKGCERSRFCEMPDWLNRGPPNTPAVPVPAMSTSNQDLWPFTRVPDWYKSEEAREMQLWECMAEAEKKINADCTVGLETVCLLYNWVDDGMLPMSWLDMKYPRVAMQVGEWAELAARESAAKDALAQPQLREGGAASSEPPQKKANTSLASMQDSSPCSVGASASTTHTMRGNSGGSANGPNLKKTTTEDNP
jgi:hypothetical protein